MKIAILSTSDLNGGAAIACYRLAEALVNYGHEVSLLVVEKRSDKDWVIGVRDSLGKLNGFLKDAQYHWNRKRLFKGDYAYSGNPWFGVAVAQHPKLLSADVINMHWVNHGYLGQTQLQSIFALQKPIIWHMHDCWSFTGGCHYTGTCTNFEQGCGHCPALLKTGAKDASFRQMQWKMRLFKLNPPVLVGSSQWLTQLAGRSALAKVAKTAHIPIPIDTQFYQAESREEARQKLGLEADRRYLLFAAMNAADKRKGFSFLMQALKMLEHEKNKPCLLVAGKADEAILNTLNYDFKLLGSLQTEGMRSAYRAADYFVIPSLEDNLPNTVLESMASGTPVIGFKTGGIAEMVDHEHNGWLAMPEDAADLAEKLKLAMSTGNTRAYREAALTKMLEVYHPVHIAKRYTELMTRLKK
ncbi:MAG: glycosyltransferase [Bacteroidia bacterium]